VGLEPDFDLRAPPGGSSARDKLCETQKAITPRPASGMTA
jgi:hypothetical protein